MVDERDGSFRSAGALGDQEGLVEVGPGVGAMAKLPQDPSEVVEDDADERMSRAVDDPPDAQRRFQVFPSPGPVSERPEHHGDVIVILSDAGVVGPVGQLVEGEGSFQAISAPA
jgi:hypothetical protein